MAALGSTPSATKPRHGRTRATRIRSMLLLERSPNWRRLLLNPGMLTNWWTHEVSGHFQQFYKDLIDGKRPKLALMAPPQYGKSKAVSDFIAWLAGVNPD